MFEKLEAIEKKYEELTKKISDPDVIANQNEWRQYMKEHAEIEPIVEKYREKRRNSRCVHKNFIAFFEAMRHQRCFLIQN